MAGQRDYYEILGVSRTATTDQIRRAYRRLARKYHPDVSKSDDAARKFAAVSEAYEVLSDTDKRKSYDRFGHAGVDREPGFPAGGPQVRWSTSGGFSGAENLGSPDIGDIFEQMFGQRGGSPFGAAGQRASTPRTHPQPDLNIRQTLKISFLTAARGGTENIRLTESHAREKNLEVKIPVGIESGAKLRLRGKGQPVFGGGGKNGDLILTIEVGGHPYFRREGLNILLEVPLTITEAALGTTVTAPLLEGSVEIRVPPGTSSGQRLRVKDQGIRAGKDRKGDFFAVVQIVTPDKISENWKQVLQELGKELKNPRKSSPWSAAED